MPGTVCAGGIGPQQQGRTSRLRKTGTHENSVTGGLRTTGSGKHLTIIIQSRRNICRLTDFGVFDEMELL
jgi:hypothetical protein